METACAEGSAIHCAAVPKGRFHWPFQIHTRSPMRRSDTPGPTASMVPAPSLCGITSGQARGGRPGPPLRVLKSEGLTPEVRSRTRTSPGPGWGVGCSPTVNTSLAGPCRV